MQFTQYDLGQKQGGEVVEVSLSGSAANVRLMDSSNFQSYRAGRQHRTSADTLRGQQYGSRSLTQDIGMW